MTDRGCVDLKDVHINHAELLHLGEGNLVSTMALSFFGACGYASEIYCVDLE